jgi:hypothetical protein
MTSQEIRGGRLKLVDMDGTSATQTARQVGARCRERAVASCYPAHQLNRQLMPG